MTNRAGRNVALRLDSHWMPGSDDAPAGYELTLSNLGATPIAAFTLCFSGPARLDPEAAIAGGRLVHQLSNHTELAPPEGFVLEFEERWQDGTDDWYAREMLAATLRGESICALSVYCTGDWSSKRQAEHAAAVHLLRP